MFINIDFGNNSLAITKKAEAAKDEIYDVIQYFVYVNNKKQL